MAAQASQTKFQLLCLVTATDRIDDLNHSTGYSSHYRNQAKDRGASMCFLVELALEIRSPCKYPRIGC